MVIQTGISTISLLHRRHQRHTHLWQRYVLRFTQPLVLPGTSRFDQRLQLTEQLVTAAEVQPTEPPWPATIRRMPKLTKAQRLSSRRWPMGSMLPHSRHHGSLCPLPNPPATAHAPTLASTLSGILIFITDNTKYYANKSISLYIYNTIVL